MLKIHVEKETNGVQKIFSLQVNLTEIAIIFRCYQASKQNTYPLNKYEIQNY